MSDTTLRQTERDLYAAAAELRSEAEDAAERREEITREARERNGEAIPDELDREFRRLGEQRREALGTAQTYEHYADAWTDEDTDECVFILEELNGDAYAAVADAVNSEAARQGTIPQGFGRIKALEYGVVAKPEGAPADPGRWPAAIVSELFDCLEAITAPSGVDMGNDSLASALDETPPNTQVEPSSPDSSPSG
jgi:hypothetical protein